MSILSTIGIILVFFCVVTIITKRLITNYIKEKEKYNVFVLAGVAVILLAIAFSFAGVPVPKPITTAFSLAALFWSLGELIMLSENKKKEWFQTGFQILAVISFFMIWALSYMYKDYFENNVDTSILDTVSFGVLITIIGVGMRRN
ncbi:hypothetical protein SAMN05720606_10188 [Paenibacillus polysaccharolyticus]|uniref:Uncharacterized protein n=1 Tax=Paenibacillus polysaccharolyticus TaxID=582692 RepID=A0A1G5ASQ1_9BACL|nr:hypothetical protein [Paenibacillus polysaccharolyticus]SCX80879.1 hypothetical protein SAMN05720606_10188 [Paenibacillus polysaccharolyticus]